MATSNVLSNCIRSRDRERKALNKKFLQTCYILWMTLSTFLLWIFACFSSDLLSYSAAAVHLSKPLIGNVLLAGAGMYGGGHDPAPNAFTHSVSVSHSARSYDDEDTQLRRRDGHGINLPAFTETATTERVAVSTKVEVGNEEEEEEEEDEEGKQEGAPEEENPQNQGTQPVNTGSESLDFEEDKIVGGPIEEEGESNETNNKVDRPESSAEHKDATETVEKRETLRLQQKTVADATSGANVEGSHQTTGNEMSTKVKAAESIESKSAENDGGHHTHEDLKAPPSGTQHREDGEEKGEEPHTTDEHPAQHISRPDSTKEEGTTTDTKEFKVQFSFKPDLVIPSVLKQKVHHREATDSSGRKWFEIASPAKPEILKVEEDDTGTIYHYPEVKYA